MNKNINCGLLFTHGSLLAGAKRAIDEMNDRLKEAGIR